MGRLIDADALRHEIHCAYSDDLGILEHIDAQQTVDAVPVRHGRWETDGMIMDDGEYLMTRCTACGEAYEYGYNMPFCPNCGAKMDGKDGNDE